MGDPIGLSWRQRKRLRRAIAGHWRRQRRLARQWLFDFARTQTKREGLPFRRDENPRNFVKQWLDLLNRVLVQSKKHASVERLVKLIASVAVSFDEAFRDFTVQYVIRKTEARDWAPRFRACQILSQTLKALPEDAELGDDIWDEIKRRMCDRLDDRAPAVRSEAVTAVQRLQDPTDSEDAIVARFCEMMRDDPSGDVRKTVICHVAICKASLKVEAFSVSVTRHR